MFQIHYASFNILSQGNFYPQILQRTLQHVKISNPLMETEYRSFRDPVVSLYSNRVISVGLRNLSLVSPGQLTMQVSRGPSYFPKVLVLSAMKIQQQPGERNRITFCFAAGSEISPGSMVYEDGVQRPCVKTRWEGHDRFQRRRRCRSKICLSSVRLSCVDFQVRDTWCGVQFCISVCPCRETQEV